MTPDTSEFLFPGSSPSVLLIHGLTGSPYEMRYVGERLSAIGVRAMGIRLAGHRGPPEELGATGHQQWYESVVDGFERLRAYGDPVVVVGLSLGAVLAARLAEDQGDAVAGLVMLAPAFFLAPTRRIALGAVSALGNLAHRIYLQGSTSDIHDTGARGIHPGIRLMPLSAPLSLIELSSIVRSRIDRISQPTLVMHGRRDHLCPWRRNVNFLVSHIVGGNCKAVVLDDSFHVITVDIEKDRVATEICDFMAPWRKKASAAGQ
jgi:carboxylesterase